MGWYGYDIYGGDDTQTQHYNFIKWAGAGTEDEILENDWLACRKTTIPQDRIPIFIKGIPKILKKMPKVKFWNEDNAIEWQMLAALLIDNKIEMPEIIKKNGILATEYLMGEHASEFKNPSARRRHLKNFVKKIKFWSESDNKEKKNPEKSELFAAWDMAHDSLTHLATAAKNCGYPEFAREAETIADSLEGRVTALSNIAKEKYENNR